MPSDDVLKLNPEIAGQAIRGRSKFNNRRVVDEQGRVFDSGMEHRRWQQLETLLAGGAISHLEHHPVFDLEVKGQLICRYEADAAYREGKTYVVEDTKGFKTEGYRLKKKLMKAIWGIDIREIRRPQRKRRRK